MKTRTFVKIISFCLAAVAVSTGFLVRESRKSMRYRNELQTVYSKSLDDFSESVNNISVTLDKARFMGDADTISNMAAKLLCEAEISKSSLAQLPQIGELASLNKFLSQIGNYALSLSKTLIAGGEIGENDIKSIELLSLTAKKIADAVNTSQITYNKSEYWADELEKKLSGALDADTLSGSLNMLDGELSDLPTLIYDGPFSDKISEKEPEIVKNAKPVSESLAFEVAVKSAECDKTDLKSDALTEGKIPAYRFSGNGITAAVTENGGETLYIRKERETEKSVLNYEQALEKAKRYLERNDKIGFKETYYSINEGICLINFAFIDGETLCYTDLIKVGVALDNGEIMLYDASTYLANHRERSFETPNISASEAQSEISGKLSVKSTCLALIPTSGSNEVRCYEFDCVAADGQEVLIYINAVTKKEEDILILLKSDGGILVK